MSRLLTWLRAALYYALATVLAALVTTVLVAPSAMIFFSLIQAAQSMLPLHPLLTLVVSIIYGIFVIGPFLLALLTLGYMLAFGITALVRIWQPVRTHVQHRIAYVIAAVVTVLPIITWSIDNEPPFVFFVAATPWAVVAATVGGLLFARLTAK